MRLARKFTVLSRVIAICLSAIFFAGTVSAGNVYEADRPGLTPYVDNLLQGAGVSPQFTAGSVPRRALVGLLINQQVLRDDISRIVRNPHHRQYLAALLVALHALDGADPDHSSPGLPDIARALGHARNGEQAQKLAQSVAALAHEGDRYELSLGPNGVRGRPLSRPQTRSLFKVTEVDRPATTTFMNRLIARMPKQTLEQRQVQAQFEAQTPARAGLFRLLATQQLSWHEVATLMRNPHINSDLPSIVSHAGIMSGSTPQTTMRGLPLILERLAATQNTDAATQMGLVLAAAAELPPARLPHQNRISPIGDTFMLVHPDTVEVAVTPKTFGDTLRAVGSWGAIRSHEVRILSQRPMTDDTKALVKSSFSHTRGVLFRHASRVQGTLPTMEHVVLSPPSQRATRPRFRARSKWRR
jgi:hypothetical protein